MARADGGVNGRERERERGREGEKLRPCEKCNQYARFILGGFFFFPGRGRGLGGQGARD